MQKCWRLALQDGDLFPRAFGDHPQFALGDVWTQEVGRALRLRHRFSDLDQFPQPADVNHRPLFGGFLDQPPAAPLPHAETRHPRRQPGSGRGPKRNVCQAEPPAPAKQFMHQRCLTGAGRTDQQHPAARLRTDQFGQLLHQTIPFVDRRQRPAGEILGDLFQHGLFGFVVLARLECRLLRRGRRPADEDFGLCQRDGPAIANQLGQRRRRLRADQRKLDLLPQSSRQFGVSFRQHFDVQGRHVGDLHFIRVPPADDVEVQRQRRPPAVILLRRSHLNAQ